MTKRQPAPQLAASAPAKRSSAETVLTTGSPTPTILRGIGCFKAVDQKRKMRVIWEKGMYNWGRGDDLLSPWSAAKEKNVQFPGDDRMEMGRGT